MTNRGLAVLALRLFAVGILVYCLFSLPQLYQAWQQDQPEGFRRLLLLVYGLGLAVAAVMWWFPGQLAQVILPARSSQSVEQPLGAEEAQVVVFSAVGVLLSAWVLPDLILLVWQLYQNVVHMHGEPAAADLLTLGARTAQFLLGLWLFLGSRGWVGLVRQLRRAGTH